MTEPPKPHGEAPRWKVDGASLCERRTGINESIHGIQYRVVAVFPDGMYAQMVLAALNADAAPAARALIRKLHEEGTDGHDQIGDCSHVDCRTLRERMGK